MANFKVLVIGESCQDVFTYVDADRLAPDLPIPILKVCQETRNPGMAANVARNLVSLGCQVQLITNENWQEVTKNRFMHLRTNHAFVRVDRNDNIKPLKMLPETSGFDAVVISDYNKGFLSDDDISLLSQANCPVFIDTKRLLGDYLDRVKLIKLNEFEYERNRQTLSHKLQEKVVVTLGDKGAAHNGQSYPVEPIEIGDASGAGDAFFAKLVVGILDRKPIGSAIIEANKAARLVVQQRGVTALA